MIALKKIITIVLGNRLNDDGSISLIQEERLKMALEIDKEFKPDYFILSGGLANPKAGRTEADAMREYLLKNGINSDRLIVEGKSLTTVENARFSVPIAKKMGADIIIVCTSLYHLSDPYYKAIVSFEEELKGTNITLMTYSR